jgi:hypothetical protein
MNESGSRSWGRTAVAGLVLLVAAWVLLGFVVHIISALASTVLIIVAVIAVVWAVRTLF